MIIYLGINKESLNRVNYTDMVSKLFLIKMKLKIFIKTKILLRG
jgi:hypothetical protein